jgi:phosphoenolpyruvate-protein kinase (PTS system EI component)
LGLQELSANAQAIPLVKNAVRNLNIHEAQRFLEQVLKQTTTAKIEQMIKETYSELLGNNNHHEWEH